MKSKIIGLILCIVLIFTLSACDKEKKELDNVDVINEEESTEGKENNDDGESLIDEKTRDIQYAIYLKNKDLPILLAEMYTISSDDMKLKEKTIEEIALEELFNFQQYEGYVSPVPKGTKVISLEKEGDTVYVDLSKEFKDGLRNKSETDIAVASIVNTLTFFQDNEYVVITIEGEKVDKLNNIDLSGKISFVETYIPDK